MKKHLNILNTVAEYQQYSASTSYSKPNVTYVRENKVLYYDYGNNKPEADMSEYKNIPYKIGEGDDGYYGQESIRKINYIPKNVNFFKLYYANKVVECCEIPDNITNMYQTFFTCELLKTVPNIPSGVTNMGECFRQCKSLIEIPELPNNITALNQTFAECSSLVTVPNIPSGATNMYMAFYNCSSLVTVPEIPSGLTNMYSTFYGCSALVNVPNIPSGVTSLYNAFYNCSSLKTVTFLATTPINYGNTLYGCTALESIYVPDSSVDAYKTATGWSEFSSKIKPISQKPTE